MCFTYQRPNPCAGCTWTAMAACSAPSWLRQQIFIVRQNLNLHDRTTETLPMLHPCPPAANVSPFRPCLRLLRRAPDPAPGHAANSAERMQSAPPSGAQRLAGAWPLRDADQNAGDGPALHWPGMSAGIRAPGLGENPLSHAEVAFAVRMGLLAPSTNKRSPIPRPISV